jgi:hypothetical protein
MTMLILVMSNEEDIDLLVILNYIECIILALYEVVG